MIRPFVTSLEALAADVASLRLSGQRVTHVRGTFDLLNRDQITALRRARDAADALVVTVAAGAEHHIPFLPADLRALAVAALPFVRAVALEGVDLPREVTDRVRADSCVDMDQRPPPPPPLDVEQSIQDATDGNGTDTARGPSTPEAEAFLREFRLRYSATEVIAALKTLSDLRVLVVGDAIIDEYHFVRPYGMPLKAAVIAAQFLSAEAYAGGVLAVANHVAGFCKNVDLLTVLGEADTREEFIRATLRPNVRPRFHYRPTAPTTVKRRYLGRYLVDKLFEVSYFDDRPLPLDVDMAVTQDLALICADYDLVVVADFGHGMLSERSIQALTSHARFLAINTQLNSINYGYHVATKYARADFVCIDENEVRMALRDRVAPVQDLLPRLARLVNAQTITVTLGNHGSLTYCRDGLHVAVPILSRQVVDAVGAGDAYLAIAAPCVCAGLAPELVGFIGNAVGGIAVRILGNKEPIRPEALFHFVRVLMESPYDH